MSSWRPAGYPLWENTGNLQGVAQWGGGAGTKCTTQGYLWSFWSHFGAFYFQMLLFNVMTWVSSHTWIWGHSWSPQAVAVTTVAGVGHPWYLQLLQWLRQQPPPERGVQLQGARGKHCAGLRKHLGDERHLGGGWHCCWLCWQDIVAGRQTKCMSMHTETSGQCFLIYLYILSPQLICSQTKSRREMEAVWSYVGRYAVCPANREAQESQPQTLASLLDHCMLPTAGRPHSCP